MKATHIAKIAQKNTSAAVAALRNKPYSASVSLARKIGINVSFKKNRREFWETVTEDLENRKGMQCCVN